MIDDPLSTVFGPAPGLPDDVFEHDGLITKRVIRAAALAELRPQAGKILWDLGAGAGSIAIEWARCAALPGMTCAYGIERDPVRAARARRNAARLTAEGNVEIREATVDGALADLPAPDAVFIGGGATTQVIEHCHNVLRPGGRLVAHGVTLETEEVLLAAHRRHGGALTRLSVETLEPLGALHGWAPLRAVVQWSVVVHEGDPSA